MLGLIQVYTGDGKGKTTAALGLALRAVGHDMKVAIVQFLKDDPNYGEFKAKDILPGFELYQVGRNDFVNFKAPEQVDLDLAQAGWQKAKEMIVSGKYDIVILDEFTLVMKYNMVDNNDVITTLQNKNNNTEIIVTGRYAPQNLLDIADLITDMANTKHYFDQGIDSRLGIDH